ncbi:hypothetical protein NC662_19275 [Haloarcula tradensis]|uniref:Uncharacterized protein n=1 Tax=Haloarcula argentinensis TaxID=43776 RepID=A0ABU2F6J1_HALAR|nr:hypothetical protein [Haloarcula argentinensis]MDS0255848.1 hypothetical protein [Haloarcula argentinensis]
MEDYDTIEIAYVLDGEPSIAIYKSLFEVFTEYLGLDYEEDVYSIRARQINGYNNNVDTTGKYDDVIQTLSSYPNWSVEIPLSYDELTVTRTIDSHNLTSKPSCESIYFSTWIYGLKDTDDEELLETVKQYRRNFAEIHAQAANTLEPKWGFGRRGGLAIGEDEAIEELATKTRPPLYEYNVFRAETVEAIGREQVLSAPAYYVEELDWGGVFMAVTEPPKQCGHECQQCDEVADQLGLSLAKTERYH